MSDKTIPMSHHIKSLKVPKDSDYQREQYNEWNKIFEPQKKPLLDNGPKWILV